MAGGLQGDPRLQALLSSSFSPGKDTRRWAGIDSSFSFTLAKPQISVHGWF